MTVLVKFGRFYLLVSRLYVGCFLGREETTEHVRVSRYCRPNIENTVTMDPFTASNTVGCTYGRLGTGRVEFIGLFPT